MIADYIDAALASARLSTIENGAYSRYAEIPAIRGAWAAGRNDREALDELRRALEAWLFHALSTGEDLPEIAGYIPVAADAGELSARYAGTDVSGRNDRGIVEAYIGAALARANFETTEDSGNVFAEAPDVPGAWAEGVDEEDARTQLREVIEDWVLTRTRLHLDLPPVAGIRLASKIPA